MLPKKFLPIVLCALCLGLSGPAPVAWSQLERDSLANVIERSEKSVVRIEVKGADGEGLGSGFVVSDDGMLVTNVHVLAGAKSAVAIFPNGKRYQLTGTLHIDEGRDICVARMKAKETTPILLSDKLPRKGETVTALGAPLGLSFTATTGIISAIRPGAEMKRELGDDSIRGTWVQVDAALSPGNSGGPLINNAGEVVAMSTRASAGGRAQNLNFGISIVDINAAISSAKGAKLQTLKLGVGRIKDAEGSGPGRGSIIKRREIPERSLENYVEEGRESFKELSRRARRSASQAESDLRELKKGRSPIPMEYLLTPSGELMDKDVVMVPGRTANGYFFRSESIKRRMVRRKQARVDDLKKLKKNLTGKNKDDAMFALLSQAGPHLDPRKNKSIGFLDGAMVLHAFNDHELAVRYEGRSFLMWAQSTTGLSLGQEIPPMAVYVAGTETMLIPGRTSISVTVFQEVMQNELEDAVYGGREYVVWRDKSGKYSIEANYVKTEDELVHLRKRDGSLVKVPLSKLDEASLKAATR